MDCDVFNVYEKKGYIIKPVNYLKECENAIENLNDLINKINNNGGYLDLIAIDVVEPAFDPDSWYTPNYVIDAFDNSEYHLYITLYTIPNGYTTEDILQLITQYFEVVTFIDLRAEIIDRKSIYDLISERKLKKSDKIFDLKNKIIYSSVYNSFYDIFNELL